MKMQATNVVLPPDTDGSIFAVEICWITGRRLELRDSADTLRMDDAIMLQIMTRH
jgi:hypothetical protein